MKPYLFTTFHARGAACSHDDFVTAYATGATSERYELQPDPTIEEVAAAYDRNSPRLPIVHFCRVGAAKPYSLAIATSSPLRVAYCAARDELRARHPHDAQSAAAAAPPRIDPPRIDPPRIDPPRIDPPQTVAVVHQSADVARRPIPPARHDSGEWGSPVPAHELHQGDPTFAGLLFHERTLSTLFRGLAESHGSQLASGERERERERDHHLAMLRVVETVASNNAANLRSLAESRANATAADLAAMRAELADLRAYKAAPALAAAPLGVDDALIGMLKPRLLALVNEHPQILTALLTGDDPVEALKGAGQQDAITGIFGDIVRQVLPMLGGPTLPAPAAPTAPVAAPQPIRRIVRP